MQDFNYTYALYGVAAALVVLKIYNKLTKGLYKSIEKLNGKTAIVTGSSTGIGFEAAKDLAQRGARVIMVCRDMKKAEVAKELIVKETGNSNIDVKHIDFSSLDSVRKCAQEILAEENRIDILLNNAGSLTKGRKKTLDGIELMMQTNHFGPFLLTNILLDRIKNSAPSRIVNVSSNEHQNSKNIDIDDFTTAASLSDWQTYCYSKLANVYFTKELAKKLQGTGVTVNALHSGAISNESTRLGPFMTFCKSKKEEAQTSIYLCSSPNVANISGEYFADCKIYKSPIKYDMGTAKKVWEISEDAVKLQANERHY